MGALMPEGENMSVETQLAVLSTKMDGLGQLVTTKIDTLTQSLSSQKDETTRQFEKVDSKINYEINELNKRFANYVQHESFKPVRLVVYGLVAIVLTSVVGGILTLVMTHPS